MYKHLHFFLMYVIMFTFTFTFLQECKYLCLLLHQHYNINTQELW